MGVVPEGSDKPSGRPEGHLAADGEDNVEGRSEERSDRLQARLSRTLVAARFGVAEADLDSPTRGTPEVALTRQVSMYLCHVVFGINLSRVAALFGRDRTTVAHACATVEDRRDDPEFDWELDLLEAILKTLERGRQERFAERAAALPAPSGRRHPRRLEARRRNPAASFEERAAQGPGASDAGDGGGVGSQTRRGDGGRR